MKCIIAKFWVYVTIGTTTNYQNKNYPKQELPKTRTTKIGTTKTETTKIGTTKIGTTKTGTTLKKHNRPNSIYFYVIGILILV
jgi:hypothetical protein